jgi:hypothetical protein
MRTFTLGLLISTLSLLVVEVATAVPPGPPFTPPGPPPFTPPGGTPVRSVPIPATHVLFGIGLAALAWLAPKIKR